MKEFMFTIPFQKTERPFDIIHNPEDIYTTWEEYKTELSGLQIELNLLYRFNLLELEG